MIFAGRYIYIETSSPRRPGDNAIISLPNVNSAAKGPQCKIVFWYHMYGGSTGRLNVRLQKLGGALTTIWTKSGNQGNKWIQGVAMLGNSNNLTGPFQVSKKRKARSQMYRQCSIICILSECQLIICLLFWCFLPLPSSIQKCVYIYGTYAQVAGCPEKDKISTCNSSLPFEDSLPMRSLSS